MSLLRESVQGSWVGRWTFVAATAGAAIGMSNLWKFSWLAGENGGAAFVIVYCFFVLLVSLPVLIAEVMIGNRGRANPISASRELAYEAGVSGAWQLIGWLGSLVGLLILSYYSVMAGLGLSYVESLYSGEFVDMSAADVGGAFNALLSDPKELAYWHSLFLAAVVSVASLKVTLGLAKVARFIVPLFIVLLLALTIYSGQIGEFDKAFAFLFHFDWRAITPQIVLVALGHAFFTLSIGLGAMMAFGAYMPAGRSIAGLLAIVVLIDTSVALLAGLAIFPLVFSLNIEPSAGPGLIFLALPYAFGHLQYGDIMGSVFFTVVSLVALSSGVALIEPAVAWLVERFRFKRWGAALVVGALAWGLGFMALLSFSDWADYRWRDMTFFNGLDYFTSNILQPLAGLLIAFFVGWRMRKHVVRDHFYRHSGFVFVFWYWLLRYIAVPAVVLILLVPFYRQWLAS